MSGNTDYRICMEVIKQIYRYINIISDNTVRSRASGGMTTEDCI